ncbi:MAG: acetyl-CoA C-acyltransferase [SAR202 cluster bacterium]|jgi:acetyl-CoA C-acetyltransferase|nr:acetyl-CoA C-acyltransferase [Chloroflexota bacterium]MCH2509075.1 acetyl-CoA C-acetyltransferase [Dehalococcoidia bacterium]MCS5655851.1 acetyl-CoA C-acetyltransferase [Dehalococcoidia bacterium]MQG49417.1 acetyl-CoA C-acyltransferase [SAR202 cluster bacterium]MQG79913.1 acetyl-CoA C-acyltransferase [SAR202 cluster bacterium]|tara:strand:- start:3837 stop:5033 length:1197 start_codon:yes stop_codon:yes gene_type:complete
MRRVAIVSPVRTAVGNFGGTLKDVPAEELACTVIKETLERSKLDPAKVDDVILGHGYPSGENPAIGRLALLKAGLPIEVPGYQLDRRCSSGLQAILNACMMVQTENADVVIAGGVESMSNAEFYVNESRWGARFGSITLHDRLARARETISPEDRFGVISGMVETAENLAKQYEISREEQDEYSLRSHQRAVAAQESGRFDSQIVPVEIPQRRGDPVIFDKDEGPRGDSSMDVLGRLRPVMKDGTVSAGNASSQNDAASVCLVVAEDKLEELGLEAMGFLKGWVVTGCHPATMGIGPVPAVSKLMEKTGMSLEDMDVIELNEAFAAQVLAVLREWKLPNHDNLNVNGSGISLGHPIAATGARILTTLLNEMERQDAQFGLETMCVGGGQGVAAMFERR